MRFQVASLPISSQQYIYRKSIGLASLLLAQPNGARFFGKQGLACSKRRSRKLQPIQFLFAPEKPCAVREVWQSQTCARSRLSLARQRKRGLRRRTSFCEVKTKPSLEGFVLTKLKQDLCKRACFYAAKRVPCAGMRRKGEQGINKGRLPEIWQTASNTTKSDFPASLALMFSGSLQHRRKAT